MKKQHYILGAIILVGGIFGISALSDNKFRDRENARLWTEERLKAYEVCIDAVLPDTSTDLSNSSYTNFYDVFKDTFRTCKNISDNF